MYQVLTSVTQEDADLVAMGVCHGHDWILQSGNGSLERLLRSPIEETRGRSLAELLAACEPGWGSNPLEWFGENNPAVFQFQEVLYVVHWKLLGDPTREERTFVIHEVPACRLSESGGASERELNALFDSIHDGIWVIDSRGITLRVNKALEVMTGIAAADLVGKHVSAPMKEGRYAACVTLRALQEKKSVTMFDDYDNGKRYLNTSTPVFDDMGNVWRVIACIRDMSVLEELQNKLIDLEFANKSYKNRIKELEHSEFTDFIGTSSAFRRMTQDIAKAARSDALTLILGETGTGKTFAAQAVHSFSRRHDKPFVVVNCGAIPPSLIESELFGYERGAFTGAQRSGKAGLFEAAGDGTIFLDEIAELPLPLQVKLLHVLDGRSVTRVGGVTPHALGARVIAATNRPLDEMVKKGEFREDLYYRLNVLTVHIPSLRERIGDIPTLARYFLIQANQKNGMDKVLRPEVLDCFARYSWPGNVRELRATVEYLVAMTERRYIRVGDLPERILAAVGGNADALSEELGLTAVIEDMERRIIEKALTETGSTWKAAKKLKISQSTVVRKAQRYKIGITEVVHDAKTNQP